MKNIRKIVCTILCFCMICLTVIPAYAAVPGTATPFSSPYLAGYSGYVYAAGGGVVQIWFDVSGTKGLADIGALSVTLYESTDNSNFYWVDTFRHNIYTNMLAHNTSFHCSYVSYNGISGYYYKAYIGVYGGDGTNGTTRYFWTSSVRA